MFEKLSVTNRKWVVQNPSERTLMYVMQKYALPEMVARIICAREIENIESYLRPNLRDLMPDPSLLLDMDKGALRLKEAIYNKEKIGIFADYDVDGATSSAILKRYLAQVGADPIVYIPDRFKEGYGPNKLALSHLAEQGVKVLLMTDCGTTAFAELEHGKELGMDIIVLDHHISNPNLPDAYALINPNRLDQEAYSNFQTLCSAGLAFLFIITLHRMLREENWFEKHPMIDLREFLDLVALGTVCDVMPLKGLNRAFVAHGLRVMGKRQNVGIKTLYDGAGIKEAPSTYHLGFILGPRINAGGRIGCSHLGSHLLSTHDTTTAMQIAAELERFNSERQAIEQAIIHEANSMVKESDPVLVLAGEDWHQGVIGIVAGRIKELYERPTFVISIENGLGKGSARGVPGVNLGNLVHKAVHLEILIGGGGHAMAAGFSILPEKIDQFREFLIAELKNVMKAYTPTIDVSGIISVSAINRKLLQALELLEPYGMGNPTPKFGLKNMRVSGMQLLGNDHVRFTAVDESGQGVKAMAFRAANSKLGKALSLAKNNLHILGTLKRNTWAGQDNITLIVEDLMEI